MATDSFAFTEPSAQWRKAVRSASTFNNTLLQEKRVRGPYYYDAHTNTIQVMDSWSLPKLSTPTQQQQERQIQEFFTIYEEKKKTNPPELSSSYSSIPSSTFHSPFSQSATSSPSPFVDHSQPKFIQNSPLTTSSVFARQNIQRPNQSVLNQFCAVCKKKPEKPGQLVPSKGRWMCVDCVRCVSCGAGMNDKWRDYKHCERCLPLVKMQRFCPVCERVYPPELTLDTMLQCSDCRLHVHHSCDGVSEIMRVNLLNSKQPFYCQPCMVKRRTKANTSFRITGTSSMSNIPNTTSTVTTTVPDNHPLSSALSQTTTSAAAAAASYATRPFTLLTASSMAPHSDTSLIHSTPSATTTATTFVPTMSAVAAGGGASIVNSVASTTFQPVANAMPRSLTDFSAMVDQNQTDASFSSFQPSDALEDALSCLEFMNYSEDASNTNDSGEPPAKKFKFE